MSAVFSGLTETGTLSNPAQIAARWRSKLFLVSSMPVIPIDVGLVYLDGCAAGGGGGGGDPTPGGGGGGGQAGFALKNYMLGVAPGDVLTISLGSPGLGGAAGATGGNSGVARLLINGVTAIDLSYAGGGNKGTPSAGGSSIGALAYCAANANVSVPTVNLPNYAPPAILHSDALAYFSGTAGGALNDAGGALFAGNVSVGVYMQAAAGGSSGGGGGHGAMGPFGTPGVGGSNGAAGGDATGYGCGGGGGSGDAPGGDGSSGFFRLYYFSAYEM